ncbi:unnamed protein product, partial [Heterotrigona itama]
HLLFINLNEVHFALQSAGSKMNHEFYLRQEELH